MDTDEVHAVDDDGMPVAFDGETGRGSLLYLFRDRDLFSVDVGEA
jgi:hypothetical protein